MKRVSVVGDSGSGKSTFAADLASRLNADYVELDAIFHLRGWQERPEAEFRQIVDDATVDGSWVVDGNYRAVHDLIIGRADAIVWLDLPRWRMTWRLVRRTVRRGVAREELWNGNHEEWRWMFSRDPEKSVILYAVLNHTRRKKRFDAAIANGDWSHLTVHRITSQREADSLLARQQPIA